MPQTANKNKAVRAYRARNRATLNAKNKARRQLPHRLTGDRESRNLRYAIRRWVVQTMKNEPCADCGSSFPHYVMDFDHVRGQKAFNISKAVNGEKLVDILAEIGKCDVVCANCHRMRTHA